jgi:hypothetical protein
MKTRATWLVVSAVLVVAWRMWGASAVAPATSASGGSATNAVSGIATNGALVGSAITTLDFIGATGRLSGSTAFIGGFGGAGGSTHTNVAGKTVYVDSIYGNDSTGLRNSTVLTFATIGAAKTAANHGDTVIVWPGTYILTNSFAKNGVDWVIHGPTEVRLTNALVGGSGAGLFDDRWTGAITSKVHGVGSVKLIWNGGFPTVDDGNSTYATNTLGAFVMTNSLSRVSGENLDIQIAAFSAAGGSQAGVYGFDGNHAFANCTVTALYQTNILVYDATLDENVAFFGNAAGIYWEYGDMDFDGDFIDTDLGYSIYAQDANVKQGTHQLWVQVPNIKGKYYSLGFTNMEWKVWVLTQNLAQGTNTGGQIGAWTHIGAGKVYYSSQKTGSPIAQNAAANWAFEIGLGGAEVWIDSQKVTATNGPFVILSTITGAGISSAGPTVDVTAMHYEDLGAVRDGFLVERGTLNLHGGRASVSNGVMARVEIGGTLNAIGVDWNNSASASNTAIVIKTNSVTIRNSTIIGPASSWSVASTSTNQIQVSDSYFHPGVTNILLTGGSYSHTNKVVFPGGIQVKGGSPSTGKVLAASDSDGNVVFTNATLSLSGTTNYIVLPAPTSWNLPSTNYAYPDSTLQTPFLSFPHTNAAGAVVNLSASINGLYVPNDYATNTLYIEMAAFEAGTHSGGNSNVAFKVSIFRNNTLGGVQSTNDIMVGPFTATSATLTYTFNGTSSNKVISVAGVLSAANPLAPGEPFAVKVERDNVGLNDSLGVIGLTHARLYYTRP